MTIQFPLNQKRYFQLGQKALEEGQLSLAADHFSASYALKKDFSLNFLLVSTLLEAGRAKEALSYAQEFKEAYEQGRDFLSLYLQCLLENQHFVEAHQILNEKMLVAQGSELKKLMEYKRIVRQKEVMHTQLTLDKKNQILEEFLNLPQEDYLTQLKKASLCHQLSQEDFFSACEKLFVDERLHYLVKSLLLEELVSLRFAASIPLLYRNQNIRMVSLKKLAPLRDTPLFQKLMLRLEIELRNLDPILEINLKEELRLSYVLLYPFEKEYILDADAWVKSYIYRFNPSYVTFADEEEKQKILALNCIQEELKHDLDSFTQNLI